MSRIKKQWNLNRVALKIDLIKHMNPPLAMAIINTYVAYQHRRHIFKVWELLGRYPETQKDYNKNLFGKILSGDISFFKMIYFANKEMWDKHCRKVPDRLALGDANGIAISFIKSISS